jgi:hypothetical protein
MKAPVGPVLTSRVSRRLLITALLLTLAALLIALRFVYSTTGGTLFLFSTGAPLLVFLSIVVVLGVLIQEYRQAHRLFSIELHQAGEMICQQGDVGDCAYFIRSGEVEVVREEDGALLARLGPGDYFGEMALISGSPRSATVRTVSEVELAVLGKQNFLQMMKLMPATEDAILDTFRERAMELAKSKG